MVIAGLNAFRSGSGEPLVLISPFWHAWAPVLPRLTRDFDVVAVDLPGFGASPLATRESASVPAMADAVGVVLSELGFGAAHIAANSLGASVGLELGRRGLA